MGGSWYSWRGPVSLTRQQQEKIGRMRYARKLSERSDEWGREEGGYSDCTPLRFTAWLSCLWGRHTTIGRSWTIKSISSLNISMSSSWRLLSCWLDLLEDCCEAEADCGPYLVCVQPCSVATAWLWRTGQTRGQTVARGSPARGGHRQTQTSNCEDQKYIKIFSSLT